MKLENIIVHEVSLVDKAANKRVFAFLKKDEKVEDKKETVVAGETNAQTTVATTNVTVVPVTPVVEPKTENVVLTPKVEDKVETVVAQTEEFDAEDIKTLQAIRTACNELASIL